MAELTDQQRFEQGQQEYSFLRPARQIAEAVGIPTTSDDALRMAAGPRASIAAYLLGAQNKLGPVSDPIVLDEPSSGPPPVRVGPTPDSSGSWTRPTPTVQAAAANAPSAPNFPATATAPGGFDEYLTDAQREVLRAKVPGNYAPLISDNPPPAEGWQRDAWRKANGYPTQAELQQKIDAFAAMEGSAARIGDEGGPAYQFSPAEAPVPPVRSTVQGAGASGLVGPQTHQDMLESPIFRDAYKEHLASGGEPLASMAPPPVRAPAPSPEVDRMGKPGVMVDQEGASRLLAQDAAREAAAIPHATRVKTMLRGAAADFLDAVPAADAIVTSALLGGAMANMSAEANTPDGRIRENSFRFLQRPLNIGQIGSDAEWLRANPAAASQLLQEGAIEADAYYQIMSQSPAEPSLEPMRQAMERIGG